MMNELLLISMILLPFATALVTAALPRAQRGAGLIGTALLLAASAAVLYLVRTDGIQTTQIGGWPAPYGITLVADHLSALLLLASSIIGTAVVSCAPDGVEAEAPRRAYYPLIHILLAAVNGALITGDLFNLYVWFELLLIASFVLIVMGDRRRRLEGALKYAVISIVGSVFFLAGVGFVYGLTGTLNMADLARQAAQATDPGPITTVSVLFIVAFGLKSAAFPFYFWLPASYPSAGVPVGALCAGLLTKVGIYALLRVFTLIFTHDPSFTHNVLLWLGAATMLVGVAGALVQRSFRRLIAFLIMSTSGFMLVGLGLFSPLGVTGSVFYLFEDAFVITALFLLSGLVQQRYGTERIERLDGLYGRSVKLTLLFFVPAFSLVGIPPIAGFWSKLLLVQAGLEASSYVIVAVLLITAVLILAAVLRVWFGPFSRTGEPRELPDQLSTAPKARPVNVPAVAVLVGVTLIITVFAGTFVELANLAADDLLHPERYISAILEN